MKRVVIMLFTFLMACAYCSELDDVRAFFDSYVNAANTYKKSVPNYYLPNATIIRVVMKDEGGKESVVIPMSVYKSKMLSKSKLARLVRYRNRYEDVSVELQSGNEGEVGSTYKISAIRYPNRDKDGLPAYFVVIKTDNGYKIQEENMTTKVQDFLKNK